jgi:hypothetical protein
MNRPRRIINYYRKVYIFRVEKFVALVEWPNGSSSEEYLFVGCVILPDNAYRDEVAHALMALNIAAPRGADHLTWARTSSPSSSASSSSSEEVSSSWPRARISDVKGVPLARLSARPPLQKRSSQVGQKRV